MHGSVQDIIATFAHEMGHFITSRIHESHGYMFLGNASMLMGLIDHHQNTNVMCASKGGSNLLEVDAIV